MKQDLTYAELSTVSPTQRIPYSSATLGRPRTAEFKRHEPTIYAQVITELWFFFELINEFSAKKIECTNMLTYLLYRHYNPLRVLAFATKSDSQKSYII